MPVVIATANGREPMYKVDTIAVSSFSTSKIYGVPSVVELDRQPLMQNLWRSTRRQYSSRRALLREGGVAILVRILGVAYEQENPNSK